MKKIVDLIDKIKTGKFPTDFPHFGGANLIITNDSKRNFHEGDILVYTDHAPALSWLVVELKTLYGDQINASNKYDFYPYIGDLIQASVNANDDLFETMLFVVRESVSFYLKNIIEIKSVKIGTQTWMSQNLNVNRFRNGDKILEARTDEEWEYAGKKGLAAWCYYDNNPENEQVYGKLYNWYAIKDLRGLVPTGWKLPSQEDWKILLNYLDDYHLTRLKSEFYWDSFEGTNDAGFSGLGGGREENGRFYNEEWVDDPNDPESPYPVIWNNLGNDASWWSITEIDDQNASRLNISIEGAHIIPGNKGGGYSVRCLKQMKD